MSLPVRAVVVRFISALAVVWAAVTLLFIIFHVLPGSAAGAVLSGGDRIASEEALLRAEQQLGLDKPLLEQYGNYWSSLLHGDLGTSFVSDRSVSSLIAEAAPASLRLAFWALVLEVLVGIGFAVFAFRRPKLLMTATTWSVLAIAVPVFVTGYVLQLVLGVLPAQNDFPQWSRLPVQGIGDDEWWFVIPLGSQWRYLLLPAITLAVVSSAILLRLTVAALREAQSAPHVEGARARGIPERLVFRRHILRNALIPLLTFLGADLVALLGSAVLTEAVFNWPGMGSLIAESMERQDIPVVLGCGIVLATSYVAVNTAVDIAYRVIDPRLRAR